MGSRSVGPRNLSSQLIRQTIVAQVRFLYVLFYAEVAQRQEAIVLGTIQCGFKSHLPYHYARLGVRIPRGAPI